MSLLQKGAAAFSILLFSSTAIAYDSEREYLLDLYYGVNIEVKESAGQYESSKNESLTAADAQPAAIHLDFPIADNQSAH